MTLYNINKEIEDLLERAVDPDTGEVDESLIDEYEKLMMSRDEKIENVCLFIKNLDSEATAIRDEEKALASRRKVAENKVNRLKDYLQYCLKGEKFSTPRCAVSFRHNKQVDVKDVLVLPEEFLRYKEPEPDKTEIRKALIAGRDVPGCTLVDSVSMQIK